MLKLTTLVSMCLLACSGQLLANENEFQKFDLEPCINGEVSASGAFPSDSAELRFYAVAEQEPCMNGNVPPDGVVVNDQVGVVDQVKTAGTP